MVAGAQTALANCARWIRAKALIGGHGFVFDPLWSRAVPVRSRPTRRQRGFTLLELMTSLVVAAILLGVGVPSYQQFVKSNRIKNGFGELTTALNVARSEASKRGTTVSVCARSGAACSSTMADWKNGWLVFVDSDSDGVLDTGEAVLASYDQTQPNLRFQARTVEGTPADVKFLMFRPSGELSSPTKPLLVVVCDDRTNGDYGRRVDVALAGRVSVNIAKVTVNSASAGVCNSSL